MKSSLVREFYRLHRREIVQLFREGMVAVRVPYKMRKPDPLDRDQFLFGQPYLLFKRRADGIYYENELMERWDSVHGLPANS